MILIIFFKYLIKIIIINHYKYHNLLLFFIEFNINDLFNINLYLTVGYFYFLEFFTNDLFNMI